MTHTLILTSRSRDVNARGKGGDTYSMLLLPDSASAVWVDNVPGAEIVADDYPRIRSPKSSDRHGVTLVRVTLPEGTIRIDIYKPTQANLRTTRSAYVLIRTENDGDKVGPVDWVEAPCTSRRAESGQWLTVIHMADGTERTCL
jgi:hypothetical protein